VSRTLRTLMNDAGFHRPLTPQVVRVTSRPQVTGFWRGKNPLPAASGRRQFVCTCTSKGTKTNVFRGSVALMSLPKGLAFCYIDTAKVLGRP